MVLNINIRHTELHDQVRAYIEKKFRWVDRQAPKVRSVEVEVDHESTRAAEKRVVVQVTLNVDGTLIRAQERAGDVHTAIDAAKDAIQRQLKRYREKVSVEKRREAVAASPRQRGAASLEAEAPSEEESEVLRRKTFAIKPMPTGEAIEQMELLGHGFFFFYNADSNQYNVVYKRKGGGYGLIEPAGRGK